MSWPTVNLSDLCEINVGKTPARNNNNYWGKGEPWLSISDMAQGQLIFQTKEEITALAIKETNIKIVPIGTVLFSFKLSIGKIGVAARDLYTNEAIAALPIKDRSVLCEDYLVHALSRWENGISINRAVMGLVLNKAILSEIKIPLPPLTEQKRIAAILDKADNIRRKRQDAIKLADEFLRAVFLDMFGNPIKNSKSWPTQPLDQVAPSSPSRGVAASKNDQVWLLNLDNIESNTGRILAEYKCSYGEVGSSTHWFDQSHVLYSKLRPYLNKVVLPHTSGIATSELLPLKPNPAVISREYLAFLLRSNPFLHWANNKVAGAKMPRLSTSELRNLLIPIPPIDLQNRFKNIVSQMSALQTKFESSSIESESLFNALSQKAFSGKL